MRNKKLKPVISKLAKEYNISEEEVKAIVESPYAFTKNTINELQLKNVTEDEFNELKTNFIYKYIGKLHTKFSMVQSQNKRYNKSK